MPLPRVILLADPSRPAVAEVINILRRGLSDHADIVHEAPAENGPLPSELDVALAIAIGGDGTLIAQARRLVNLIVPLVGVNVGKLGFLAEFDCKSLIRHAPAVFGDNPPTRKQMMLETVVRRAGGKEVWRGLAVNDAVITAGPPFHVIDLQLTIDGEQGPPLSGDGVIVATPTGSTAYNVSAGGPIIHPGLDAMVITPLAAHSLAFRPIVIPPDCDLEITVVRANAGTAIVIDGQETIPLQADDRISISRHAIELQLVINPSTSYWRILQDKLRWAAPPRYRQDHESPACD